MIQLNDWQTQISIESLNHYWHYIIERLSNDDLGDIERKNLESAKEKTLLTLKYLIK